MCEAGVLCAVVLAAGGAFSDAVADNRPWEFVAAGRDRDEYPPLVDFETDRVSWRVETVDSAVSVSRSKAQQCFGEWTLRVAYRATGDHPTFDLLLENPLPVDAAADTFSTWMWFDHFGIGCTRDPTTPSVTVTALFTAADGKDVELPFTKLEWRNWYLALRKLPKGLSSFRGYRFAGGTQRDEREFFLDNVALFKERKDPLVIAPRPKRNLIPLKGADQGLNTGAGVLPFPTREETSRPESGEPSPGEPLAAFTGRALSGSAPEKLETSVRRVGRTLIVDFYAPPGAVTRLTAGFPSEAKVIRTLDVPYFTLEAWNVRLGVDVLEGGLFRLGFFDWYRSNASQISISREARGCAMNVSYLPDSDGNYKALSERLFITLSPKIEETFPTLANPVSPYKSVTGSRLWRVHASGNPAEDRTFWTYVHRYGMRNVMVFDHETQWRDGGESFTCRTEAARGKGGDEWLTGYSRYLRETLGFLYGPYNNFIDFAPINRDWTLDLVSRDEHGNPRPGWMRCYTLRPALTPSFCEKYPPVLKRKFGFNAGYCDVHTAAPFWYHSDYDARVPGAAVASAVFYEWGETLLLQKRAWEGPVYSEGHRQMFYAGLTDGNYALDRGIDFDSSPWILDYDLRKLHDHECSFGMGWLQMFAHPRSAEEKSWYLPPASTPAAREELTDRYIGCTMAYGHIGYLVMDWCFTPDPKPFGGGIGRPSAFDPRVKDGLALGMRSYFMVQQAAARYSQATARQILYFGRDGQARDLSAAVLADEARQQVAVSYSDGTCVVVNGDRGGRLKTAVFGRDVDLPPNGYAVWTADGAVSVELGDRGGRVTKFDYAESPEYVFIDGRGRWSEGARARADGTAVCRRTDGGWEIISLGNRPCAFRIPATCAEALDFDGRSLGAAEVRRTGEWFSVVPVAGAVSYLCKQGGEK